MGFHNSLKVMEPDGASCALGFSLPSALTSVPVFR